MDSGGGGNRFATVCVLAREGFPASRADGTAGHAFSFCGTTRAGQFELVRLADGNTLVVGTSWYQHGLEPAWYWRWWTDLVVHHIHQRGLNHIRTLSEQGQDQLARSAH